MRGGFGPGAPFVEGGPFGDEDGRQGPWEPGRGRRGPRGRGGRPRFASEARDAFRAAVHIARERGDDQLSAEHLLLGILEVNDPASRAVVESATSAEDLTAAVLASLEVDAEV